MNDKYSVYSNCLFVKLPAPQTPRTLYICYLKTDLFICDVLHLRITRRKKRKEKGEKECRENERELCSRRKGFRIVAWWEPAVLPIYCAVFTCFFPYFLSPWTLYSNLLLLCLISLLFFFLVNCQALCSLVLLALLANQMDATETFLFLVCFWRGWFWVISKALGIGQGVKRECAGFFHLTNHPKTSDQQVMKSSLGSIWGFHLN